MSRPIVIIHNVETNEIVEREMNDKEFKQYEEEQLAYAKEIEAAEQKALAKEAAEAKLAALGLTPEDLKALGLG